MVELSSADNDINAMQFHNPRDNATGLTYAELIDATITEAIEWGNGFQLRITLHIYDKIHDFKPKHKIMIMDDSTMHKFEVD